MTNSMDTKMIKGAMFDLDGTLLDTIGDISDTMNGLMRKYGLPLKTEAEYAAMVGYGAPQFVEDNFPGDYDRMVILEEYRESLKRNSMNRTKVFEGIPGMLSFLADNSLPIAILTNKPQDSAKAVCAHYLSRWKLSHVTGQVDGIPHKPHTGQALEIIADWGIRPEECFYMGDTATDMATARNAGFFAVGCTWGFRDRTELEQSGADAIVDTPEEVIKLLTPR